MATTGENRTKRNLLIFTALVLGLAALARIIETLTISPGVGLGTPGLGMFLWITKLVDVIRLLRAFGGDGWTSGSVKVWGEKHRIRLQKALAFQSESLLR